MIINHNMSAMYADRQLGVTQGEITKGMEKLSSGMRINRASDDASGLAVSEKMRAQIRGLNQAERNIQDGVSFIRVTEGYLQETQDILHRVRELSIQSANGIYSAEDRGYIQVEVDQLISEVNRIASHAQFNGMNLLTGRFAQGNETMQFHVGANMDQNIQVFVGDMTAGALGVEQVDLTDIANSNQAIGTVDAALQMVTSQRADLGAYQNRLESAARSVAVGAENTQAAESRIRDANMASQMVNYTRDSILNQSGVAMLAQANMRSQSVLQLL